MARKGRKAATLKRRPSKARPKPKVRSRPKGKPRGKPKAKPKARPRPTKVEKAPKPAKPPVAVRPVREEFEEETVCSIEFLSDNRSFIARLDTVRGGMREHKAPSFTDLLELVAEDLREEFLEA